MTDEKMDVTDQGNDETDAQLLGFSIGAKRKRSIRKYPQPSYDALEYDMNNRERGIALIINHIKFSIRNKRLSERTGSKEDGDRFEKVLCEHHFKVRAFNDLTKNKVFEEVNKVASEDHTHHDCLVIVIMSHGGEGVIYSKDDEYKLESIMEKFTADKCKTLAGKPKLFFIQACRGDRKDDGVMMRSQTSETDASPCFNYKIPIYADFLIAYSTVPGFVSWRSASGSYYIQTLCEELEKNGKKYELMRVLTFVNRRIAYEFESFHKDKKLNEMKQIPCITSMLTGVLQFNDKIVPQSIL